MVLADATPWSWCPPSSRPVAPHFSYQAPTSAYQAPYSALSGAGSFGVSRISSTYFTRVSFSSRALGRTPFIPSTNAIAPIRHGATGFCDLLARPPGPAGSGPGKPREPGPRLPERHTRRRPDQSSSTAATFTSTRPRSSAYPRSTESVMSLSCPPARRGHRAHTAPAGKTRSASPGRQAGYLPGSAGETRGRRPPHRPRPVRARPAARSAPSRPGGESRSTRSPALSPSLRACGVPAMPATARGCRDAPPRPSARPRSGPRP